MKAKGVLVGLGLAILAITIFLPVIAVFTSNHLYQTAQTPAIKPLHTDGHLILDSNGNPVYFRGIGRAGDLDSLSGAWGGRGDNVFEYGMKWQTDMRVLAQKMDETFACYSDVWKVNLIRVFVPVDWWWIDKINPRQQYGVGPDEVMSYRNYIELVVTEAAKYGIYVDFSPYQVQNYYVRGSDWDGIPGSLELEALAYMESINASEIQAWRLWWSSVVERLGPYRNVIFEMWNEPDDGTTYGISPAATAYFNYSIEIYKTIRDAGNKNLIFMQWHANLVPNISELDWVPVLYDSLRGTIGLQPVNVAFTAHPYRRGPYPNLQWSTDYNEVKAQLNLPNMVPATRSNGVDVPLVFNEMGVMADQSVYSDGYYGAAQQPEKNLPIQSRISNELLFWSAILDNAKEMSIGVSAFYWMQTGVWFGGEALVTGAWAPNAVSPVPSQAGKIFIDAY